MSIAESVQRNAGLRRGAAVLPSIFTMTNLFLGFAAIARVMRHDFDFAAQLMVLAVICDVLDGRIARITGMTSELGAQLDSLSDMVSFGLAPAVIAYQWGLATADDAVLAAFLYVMCAAIRLARFNVQRTEVDPRYFVGLPSPAAAALVVALVAVVSEPPAGRAGAWLTVAFLVIPALLMVSSVPYWSFKSLDLRGRRSWSVVAGLAGLVLVVLEPSWALLVCAAGYAASGPVLYLLRVLRGNGDDTRMSSARRGRGRPVKRLPRATPK